MPKRGRTPVHPSEVRQHQTIELDSQHLYRISTIERVALMPDSSDPLREGWLLSTYRGTVKLFFTNADQVMLVDESTLTHTPFD